MLLTDKIEYFGKYDYLALQCILGQMSIGTSMEKVIWENIKISYDEDVYILTIMYDTDCGFASITDLKEKLAKILKKYATLNKDDIWDRTNTRLYQDIFNDGIINNKLYVAKVYKLYDKLLERHIRASSYGYRREE